jgi:hypothetical protein
MVEAALRRNRRFVERGRAEFLVASLENLDLSDRRFDLVFAVRVALFHREPERARALVAPWLTEHGRVQTFYDTPGEDTTHAGPAGTTR